MEETRCWFCGRGRQELLDTLPQGFWDEQQSMFFEVEVIGNVCGVDRVRQGDPGHNRHFYRQNAPEDEVGSFDERRFAIVSRKRMIIPVCRVCRSVEMGLSAVSEDGKGAIPYRSIYTPGSEELTVARSWERVKNEDKRMAYDYPEDAYRVLTVLQQLDVGAPISLWDLSVEMRVFNHRTLEKPMVHILKQCPELGELDRRNLVLRYNDPFKAVKLIDDLVAKYEQFYDRNVTPPLSEGDEGVLAKVKRLNSGPETLKIAKW